MIQHNEIRLFYGDADNIVPAEGSKRRFETLKAAGAAYHIYLPQPNGTVAPAGAQKYCESAAVLVRVVFANRDRF
jgi:hypothetical protein